MTDHSFQSLTELSQALPDLKRNHKLHPITEKRLALLLQDIYPGEHPIPEPGEIPGGRSDLAFYFGNGSYAVFEIFATVSQVAEDLRHLEQSHAQGRIAILVDPALDGGRIFEEYFRKRPREPFPWIKLSDILVTENASAVKDQLRQYIEDAFASTIKPSPELRLGLFRMDRAQSHEDDIVVNRANEPLPWRFAFGLALENTKEATFAKGIGITVSLYWGGGDTLQKAVDLDAPSGNEGWKTQSRQLIDEHSANITFNDPNLMCFHKQPIEWRGFTITLHAPWKGYLHLHYTISSLEPFTEKTDMLKIAVDA